MLQASRSWWTGDGWHANLKSCGAETRLMFLTDASYLQPRLLCRTPGLHRKCHDLLVQLYNLAWILR